MLFCSDHFEFVCFNVGCRLEFLCGSSRGKELQEILSLQYFRIRKLSKTANQY